MSDFDDAMKSIARFSWDDATLRNMTKIAEPLVVILKPGKNYMSPKQFLALAIYLLEQEGVERATSKGRFAMGDIQIVKARYLRDDRTTNIRGLARMTGVPLATLARRLESSNVPFVEHKGAKFYNIDTLREHLESVSRDAL